MAFPLFIISLLFTITKASPLIHGGFLLKLTKDPKTHQHTTQILIGTPQIKTKLVVHLAGDSLWLNCPSFSSSRNLVGRRSLPCSMAKSIHHHQTKNSYLCEVQQENPVTGVGYVGDLAQDVVSVNGNGVQSVFLFSCSPEYLLSGLATGANGVLGFGRSKMAFHSQMVNSFDIARKFTVCLSPSAGFIFSGNPISPSLSSSLSYTPLISRYGGQGYYMHVNSIKVGGRRLAVKPINDVEISSIVPYTTMKTSTYSVFSKAYILAANAMNMTAAPPVAPFTVCFKTQSTAPEIEFELQSQMVKWGIQRRNSMVEVSDSVMCLGFLDGGLGMDGEVVLGGYQLEDYVMEFDLGTGMMGFSSSLLINGNSCSNIRVSLSRPTESL